jgi:calcium-dependent protein kinase
MGHIESKNSTKDSSSCEETLKSPQKNKKVTRINQKYSSTNVDSSTFWASDVSSANVSDNKEEENTEEEVFRRIEMTCGSLNYDIRKVYCFKELIGGGHFGKVHVAHKKRNPEKLYAVKSIKKKNLTPKQLKNLVQEVEILSSLDHPNIVKFHETYQDEMFFHIVMDYCSGQELIESIIKEGHLTESKVCTIIHKVLTAISYCHNMNFCHRDLKPENIIFESTSSDSEVKLIDFGLSSKFKNNEKMHTILGTPYYIAPEVLKGDYDNKCDIWSIGTIAYLMLTGNPPFNGRSTKDVFNEIVSKRIKYLKYEDKFSAEAINFLQKCLERDPAKRLSAQEALNHNWFKIISEEIHSNSHLHANVLENLRVFSAPGELKKMVLKFLINDMNTKELQLLKETFNAMDYTQEGFLSLSDLAVGFKNANIHISQKEIKTIFKRADLDRDGKVNYSDFLAAAMDQKKFLAKDVIINAFNHFDFDASNFIDIDDLEKALLSTGHEVVHKEDLDNIIAEVSNNENKISLEQFRALFGY